MVAEMPGMQEVRRVEALAQEGVILRPGKRSAHRRLEDAALESLRQCATDLDRYLYLRSLRERDEPLFFSLLVNNAQNILPYVYTPTVGEACQKYSSLPIITRGLVLTPADKGRMLDRLRGCQWANTDTRVIVVTDGERILGLGDLGYGGMGISEGKILLYSVIAGVDPKLCLPVCLDVGTNNQALLNDPDYKGLRQPRLRGEEYDALVEEFMSAVRAWQPHCLVQFEDFGNTNAFRLLDRYRQRQCCFNDDIQGTACITLAGLLSALRVTGGRLEDQKILFLGAGEAGTGIGQLIAKAVMQRNDMLSPADARKCCLFVDSKGLVCKSRLKEEGGEGLQHHKIPFAHDVPFQPDLLSVIKEHRPTMLIGVSAQGGAFSEEVVRAMAQINARPIIFPLSNPTSKAECTFKDAFKWTNGMLVFASGSPFASLKTPSGDAMFPAQANNAYIFGPVGMAAMLTQCRTITDGVFMAAAEFLAELTPRDNLDHGMLFPSFSSMKTLVVPLIARIAKYMVRVGLGEAPAGVIANAGNLRESACAWEDFIKHAMFQPSPATAAEAAAAAAAFAASESGPEWDDFFKRDFVHTWELHSDSTAALTAVGCASTLAAQRASAAAAAAAAEAAALEALEAEAASEEPQPEPLEGQEGTMKEMLLLRKMADLERHLYLHSLQEQQPRVFWQLISNYSEELMQFMYMPAEGEACSCVPLNTSGLILTPNDRGRMLQRLQAWPQPTVRVIVVRDGERILGDGDMCCRGMSISESRLIFYSMIAGVDRDECMPVCLDVGTDDPALLADPTYKGVRHRRLRGEQYDALVDEFMSAVKAWQPNCLVQFEDLSSSDSEGYSFRTLEHYPPLRKCFDSDDSEDGSGAACFTLPAMRVIGDAGFEVGTHSHASADFDNNGEKQQGSLLASSPPTRSGRGRAQMQQGHISGEDNCKQPVARAVLHKPCVGPARLRAPQAFRGSTSSMFFMGSASRIPCYKFAIV